MLRSASSIAADSMTSGGGVAGAGCAGVLAGAAAPAASVDTVTSAMESAVVRNFIVCSCFMDAPPR